VTTRALTLLILALGLALPAAAQEPPQPVPPGFGDEPRPLEPQRTESPRWGTFEVSLGGYRPNIDSDPSLGGKTPFTTAFGTGRSLIVRVDLAYSLFVDFGSLDVGIGGGFTEKFGKGVFTSNGAPSPDSTAIKIIPIRLSVTYRFDVLANRYRWMPLAPYARVSLDRYNWWVTNGAGDVSNAQGRAGRGATNGYSFSGGVALLLDAIDPGLAREMDRDTGINHTYLFVDFTKSFIRDFGSSSSWDLSDTNAVSISGGLLFVF
jgi:hypothetical protein